MLKQYSPFILFLQKTRTKSVNRALREWSRRPFPPKPMCCFSPDFVPIIKKQSASLRAFACSLSGILVVPPCICKKRRLLMSGLFGGLRQRAAPVHAKGCHDPLPLKNMVTPSRNPESKKPCSEVCKASRGPEHRDQENVGSTGKKQKAVRNPDGLNTARM